MRIFYAATLVLGVWPWLCPSALESEVVLVDIEASNCSDTGGAPYCHIQAAIDRASPGATVEIAAGVYELWGESLSIDKSLTLRGAGADRTIIDGNGKHPGPLISIADTAPDVGIRALRLVNRARIVSTRAGAGGIDTRGDDIEIRLKGVVLAGNTSQNDPVRSDCSAESDNIFKSLGGNLIGNGDGCKFQAVEGDTVGP